MTTDTIQAWYGHVAAEDADYQSYWRLLDAAEQDRAVRFRIDLLRLRYVEAHGRLRKLLAGVLGEAPEKIRIKTDEYGKPYLVDAPELVFNLSHSENAVLIALGRNCRLGVDIEFCAPRTGLAGLVDKCFSDEEIAYWNQLPESLKTSGFYRFWTRKEAFVKATGLGIGLGLNRCVINLKHQTRFLRIPEECGPVSIWHVLDVDLGPDICGAIAVDKLIAGIECNDLAR